MDEDKHLWVTSPLKKKVDLEKVRGCLISEYVKQNCESCGWGDAIAFESAESGKKYTYNQVCDDGRAFAAGLIKLGPEISLHRQDVVAVILPNVPEYAAILFGIWGAGLVASPFNPSNTEYEMCRQLEASRSKVIITTSQLLSMARAMEQKVSAIKKIIILDMASSEPHEDCLSYFAMLETDTNGVDFFTGSQMTTDNDVALLPFSSGTSGPPKGVMLTHFALLSNTSMFSQPEVYPIRKFDGITQDRSFSVLPMFHIYGFVSAIATNMLLGVHTMTFTAFNPSIFIQKLIQFKPTFLHLVPTLISFIANTDQIGPSELEQVTTIMSGAASAGETLIGKLKMKAKHIVFGEGYGLTEGGPVVSFTRYEKIGSVGEPFPDVVVKFIDIVTGATVGQGERGELCVRSPSIMKGYVNNEQATRECIDEDGWLHTGDVGYYDEDGCLFIVDRLKELIKVKGYQVAPSELEDLIRSHENVADVGVIGIPDERSGEVPRAYVVPKGDGLTEDDIIGFVQSKVSSYKRLRGGVQLVTEIPKGGSGKILRKVLKDNYAALDITNN